MSIEKVVSPWGEEFKVNMEWPDWRRVLEHELHNKQSFCFGQISYAIDHVLDNESTLDAKPEHVEGHVILDYIVNQMKQYPNGLNQAVLQAVKALYGIENIGLRINIVDWLEDE